MSFPSPLTHVALALALLGHTNLVAAQSAPAPAPRQILTAPPPPQQAAPASAYPAAPPAQGVPGAYAQPPAAPPQQAGYPQQPGTYAQPQGTYAPPPQQPGAYPPPQPYQQQPPPPGYVTYPNAQPLYQPTAQPLPFRPARANKGLMITGISILGGSYLLSMAIGAALLDGNDDSDNYDSCDHCRDVAPWLFVPVVGPFVAMSRTDAGDWGLWFLGMVEVVGAGLMTGGIIKYRNSKRAADMQGYSWSLPHDRKLTVDVASSARFSGPRLRLDF